MTREGHAVREAEDGRSAAAALDAELPDLVLLDIGLPGMNGREEMIFDPLHYLALLEQKTNALDQAAPLAAWQLPEEFGELRRQMEAICVTAGSP